MLTISKKQTNVAGDARVTLQVKSKLAMVKSIPSRKLSVETTNGVVFLKGALDSKEQASSAIELAGSVKGVKKVDTSSLEVLSSKHPFVDVFITAKVKGAFIREELFGDKSIDSFGINVETKDGVVYLSGKVDDKNVEKNAINLAKQIDGVTEVISSINKDVKS